MINFAAAAFRRGRPLKDGAAQIDHDEASQRIWKKSGLAAPAPETATQGESGPEFPMQLLYLWRWFQDLAEGLPQSGFGAPAVDWVTLAAWCGLTQIKLLDWEASALVRLGQVRAGILNEALSNSKNEM